MDRFTAAVAAAAVTVSVLSFSPVAARHSDSASSSTVGHVELSTAGELTAVSAVSARDAWAVGGRLVEHWNGTKWQVMPKPDVNVSSVAAVSATDVWAVGGNHIVHWDGQSWTRFASPIHPPAGAYETLNSIAANGPDDVWVVGTETEVNPQDHAPVSARWDGTSWRALPVPNHISRFGRYGAGLNSVSVLSATDAWAVGGWGQHTSGHTFAVQWDGSQWTRSKTLDPNGPNGQGLDGVCALSDGTVYAVGQTGQGSRQKPLVERWDGSAWQLNDPPAGDHVTDLFAVAMSSGSDGWVLSEIKTVAHWDGTAWTITPTPKVTRFTGFRSIAAVSPTDAWVVGYNKGNALIEHWNGVNWTLVQH